MSTNYFTDNDDLQYYVRRGVDWQSLFWVTEYGGRAEGSPESLEEATAFYGEILSLVGELAATQLGAHSAKVDTEHPHLVDGEVLEGETLRRFFDSLREVELHRLCIPRELEGLNAPLLVYFLCGELIARGDVSAMTHFSFHAGIAMALLVYSIQEGTTSFDVERGRLRETRFADAIRTIASGEAWGCMDITEPNAGSDMAALRTRATLGEDGQWRIRGQKIYITSGHARFHLVIARSEEPGSAEGLEGLSMFLVDAWETLPDGTRVRRVVIDRVEEKLGHNGSVTAALTFEDAPAELIGRPGEGFRYMLTLMNNARIGVGFESIGLAEAALRAAESYAAERPSMGRMIAHHEMIAELLEEMRTDVRALRALAVEAARHEELNQKLALLERFVPDLSEAEQVRMREDLPVHRRQARRLTPLLKYMASEKAVEIARRAIQIHGGAGYTKDYPVEKLLRDSLVLPIYEGTSQIQSLMVMKDSLLGIIRDPKGFFTRQAQSRLRAVTAPTARERGIARIETCAAGALQFLMRRTFTEKLRGLRGQPMAKWKNQLTHDWDPKRDFALAMLHAERLTRLLALEAIGEVLLAQAQRHPERGPLLDTWLERAVVEAEELHTRITTTGDSFLARLDALRG
jgi:alkylation response protein AidB-like acyl-CoA dehydrogenase